MRGSARRTLAIAALAGSVGLAGCTKKVAPLVPPGTPTSVRVDIPEGERGTPGAPLAFALDEVPFSVGLTVLGADGSQVPWDGWIELRIEPGEVVRIEGAVDAIDSHVRVTDGSATGLTVYVAKAFSEARIWAEDIGFVPADPATAGCANGMDDDGDGLADWPSDPGCRYANDDQETPGSHAAGVSPPLYFVNPGLDDMQGFQGESPLTGRRVTVDQGTMIVTRVATDGFNVSEIELDAAGNPTGQAVPWAHAFVFNFSTPPYLRECDRILRVSGGVVEFFGFTEMGFPSWDRDIWCPPGETCPLEDGRVLEGGPCLIPEPVVLDDALLGTPDMEQWEAALVRVHDATLPTRFGPDAPSDGGSNCDFNGDGQVDLGSGPEGQCNDQCAQDGSCSEWNQYLEFGQFSVRTAGRSLNVVTRDSVPDLNPLALRGETLPALTGTLRHFAPLGPELGYILEPRCQADVVMPGEPIPPRDPESPLCVTPRTIGAEPPN